LSSRRRGHGGGRCPTANTVLDLGVGQDFVFTLPRLSDAIDYAVQRVEPGDAAHWDAQAVLR